MDDLIRRQDAIALIDGMIADATSHGIYPRLDPEYVKDGLRSGVPSAQLLRWDTCFSCPLSHGCPVIKGCTNDQAEQYAGEIPTDCPLDKESAQSDTCEGCKWEDAFGYGECQRCRRRMPDCYER